MRSRGQHDKVYCSITLHVYRNVQMSTNVLLYDKDILCISCHFEPLKPLMLQLDHAKLLPVRWFVMSLPENHATSSYISFS